MTSSKRVHLGFLFCSLPILMMFAYIRVGVTQAQGLTGVLSWLFNNNDYVALLCPQGMA